MISLKRERSALSPAAQNVLTAVAAFLLACFFTFGSNEDDIYAYGFWIFESIGKSGVFVSTAMVVGLYWILKRFCGFLLEERISSVQTAMQVLLSVFFTGYSLLSQYLLLNSEMGLGLLTERLSSKISILLAFLGGMIFFMLVFRLIWRMSGSAGGLTETKNTRLLGFFGKHAFRNCVLLLAIVWLPQYLIRFPGTMCYDAWRSIGIYFGDLERTTQHPLIWVTIIGKLTEIGMQIGINWLAPLVICAVQHVLLILLVAYTVSVLRSLGASVRVQAVTLLFYAIFPPMFMYASTVYNDTLYSAAIQLVTVELAVLLFDREVFFSRWHHMVLTALGVLSTILRYNGLYVMAVMILFVAVSELVLLIKRHTRLLRSAGVLFLLIVPLISGQMIQKGFNELYGVRDMTSRAKLAMVIQQVGRCLAVYGDKIPKEDYDTLHAVMTWTDEEYREKYNPRRFDDIKNSFRTDATKEEMAAFLKAWLHLVQRYPGTCFIATAHVNFYLFSPLVQNVRYYPTIDSDIQFVSNELGYDASELFGYDNFNMREPQFDLFFVLKEIYPASPFVGLLVNQAVYTILLAGICVCTLFKRDRRVWVMAAALMVTLGVAIIGPAVNGHPRYTYPIMFSMPVLVYAFMCANPRQKPEPIAKEDAQ